MRLAGHVARLGKTRVACKVLIWKLEGKNKMEDVGVYGRIILNRFRRRMGEYVVDSTG
jgi:hypothetical protein